MQIFYVSMNIPTMAGKANGVIYLIISIELKGTEIEKRIIREVIERYK